MINTLDLGCSGSLLNQFLCFCIFVSIHLYISCTRLTHTSQSYTALFMWSQNCTRGTISFLITYYVPILYPDFRLSHMDLNKLLVCHILDILLYVLHCSSGNASFIYTSTFLHTPQENSCKEESANIVNFFRKFHIQILSQNISYIFAYIFYSEKFINYLINLDQNHQLEIRVLIQKINNIQIQNMNLNNVYISILIAIIFFQNHPT